MAANGAAATIGGSVAYSQVRLTADEMPGAMSTSAAAASSVAASNERDPRELLLAAPMSTHQIIAVAITVALCALDGFDILAITFAAPGIVAAWGIDRTQLGIVFAVGLAGIAAGSLLVAPLADLIGRRAMILWCLAVMTVGTLLCAFSGSVASLTAYRLLTGLGIGAMIATINPLAAEYANARRRDLSVGLMAVGFPLGGVLGGAIVAWLLRHYDWRSIFIFAALLSVSMVPVVLRWMPEPIGFLIERRSPRSLQRVNAFLARCGHAPVSELPPARSTAGGGARLADIFGADLLGATLLITAIYFLYVMTVYFFLSWIPTLVADLGYSASVAASVSAIANLSGVAGGALLGCMAHRFGLKLLSIVALLGMAACTAGFGSIPANLTLLKLAAGAAGFFLFAGMIGLYAVIARTFPTHVRATGTGFVIGIGRAGSALAPLLAGLLFAAGLGRGVVCMLMAIAAVAAAVLLTTFRVRAPSV